MTMAEQASAVDQMWFRLSTAQRVRWAIYCAQATGKSDGRRDEWAARWLSGVDRTAGAAAHVLRPLCYPTSELDLDDMAWWAAAQAAKWQAEGLEPRAWDNARAAAEWATWSAERRTDRSLNLVILMNRAMADEPEA